MKTLTERLNRVANLLYCNKLLMSLRERVKNTPDTTLLDATSLTVGMEIGASCVVVTAKFILPTANFGDGGDRQVNIINIADGVREYMNKNMRPMLLHATDHAAQAMRVYMEREKLLDIGNEVAQSVEVMMKGSPK